MDLNLLWRYLLEFAILIPATIMTLVPCRNRFQYRVEIVCIVAIACVMAFVALGSVVAMTFGLPTNFVLVPGSLLLLIPFWRINVLEVAKKLHCFLNAFMLCTFAKMYSTFATAPWELGNDDVVFTVQSGVFCLFFAFALCALFFRSLAVKLPSLFAFESLDGVWKWIALAALAMTVLMAWITPENAENVLTGQLFQKSLVILLLIPAAVLLMYHAAWATAMRIAQGERFKRENDLLKMEERRQEELLSYIDDARATRHDFRHHMAVVAELASEEGAEGVVAYANDFVGVSNRAHASKYCDNGAVDAVAAHYDRLARERGVCVKWALDFPAKLPITEVDICSVLGNLAENAIDAAAKCDENDRTVEVKASSFPGGAVTIVVENPFSGTLVMGRNGLPRSTRVGHGTGLVSVAAIAKRYGGSLSVVTDGPIFSATVVLYSE